MTSSDKETEKQIDALVNQLKKFEAGKPLDKFIKYAVFPKYKSLETGAKINFDFPITVLAGPNGTGKTTLLQAFWGMPEGNSLGRFWFSTSIDAIEEGGEDGQHRFVYGHWLASEKKVVATRKARVTRPERGPDYWEPTKVVIGDGMEKMPPTDGSQSLHGRTKDRWNAVERKALFLKFKSELSAYDKYMYFGRDPKLTTMKTRQDVIRRDSARIKYLIDTQRKDYTFYGRAVASENRLLDEAELTAVGQILGRKYLGARIIRHRLFGGNESTDGLTVIFIRQHATYSEAHAGSGEVAVVSAVIQVLAAEKYSLLLLDEPEVSLHPLAQRRLMVFLLQQVQKKFHQVIISSHSAEMFRGLPTTAVKLLEETTDGKFRIREGVSPSMAFSAIGAPAADRLSIYVEDELAAIVVKKAIAVLPEAERVLVDVRVVPSGATGIYVYQIPTLMLTGSLNILVLLDGDQKPEAKLAFLKTCDIPESENENLSKIIRGVVKGDPKLQVSGFGGNADLTQKIKLQRAYIDWYLSHVKFLPLSSPEHIILAAILRTASKTVDKTLTNQQAKEKLLQELGRRREDIDEAAEVNYIFKQKLFECVDSAHELTEIVDTIRPFINKLNTK